jgi:sugar phosphate isomerase/epimerase
MSLADWIDFAAGLKLDGVDLTLLFLDRKNHGDLSKLRQLLRRRRLSLCMVACYPDFTHPDGVERALQTKEMIAAIRKASYLGARFLRVTAGQSHPGVTREQGVRWAIEGLRQILPVADEAGVTLVYENHSKGTPWDYWDFSQPSGIFLEILNALADTSLRVNFDTANPLVAREDPLWLLEAVRGRLGTVHAADVAAPGVLQPVVLGTGIVPFEDIFRILKHTGYDGWICIEEASHTGASGFRSAVSFVREAWEKA